MSLSLVSAPLVKSSWPALTLRLGLCVGALWGRCAPHEAVPPGASPDFPTAFPPDASPAQPTRGGATARGSATACTANGDGDTGAGEGDGDDDGREASVGGGLAGGAEQCVGESVTRLSGECIRRWFWGESVTRPPAWTRRCGAGWDELGARCICGEKPTVEPLARKSVRGLLPPLVALL